MMTSIKRCNWRITMLFARYQDVMDNEQQSHVEIDIGDNFQSESCITTTPQLRTHTLVNFSLSTPQRPIT